MEQLRALLVRKTNELEVAAEEAAEARKLIASQEAQLGMGRLSVQRAAAEEKRWRNECNRLRGELDSLTDLANAQQEQVRDACLGKRLRLGSKMLLQQAAHEEERKRNTCATPCVASWTG
jgi:hypothetical protein